MKILLVHNAYRDEGGEDVCVRNEVAALNSASELEVSLFSVRTMPGLSAAMNAALAPWGRGEENRLESALREFRPDVVHVHNLYPLLSARVFKTAKSLGARTVQTLHNFRPICLNGLFLTPKLEICERCTPDNHRPGVIRGCYRGSRIQSAGLAAHLAAASHGDWYEDVDLFIAPSHFLKEKYESFSPFKGRVAVQGHFVPFEHLSPPSPPEPYLLYLGRLSEEKGVRWLLSQFEAVQGDARLVLAGNGPLTEEVLRKRGKSIHYAGYVEKSEKALLLSRAMAVVMPSECYENFPMALAEAALLGVPGLVPDHGGLSERVTPGLNGERYKPRDETSFWTAVKRLQEWNQRLENRIRCQTRANDEFSQDRFLKRRIELYQASR